LLAGVLGLRQSQFGTIWSRANERFVRIPAINLSSTHPTVRTLNSTIPAHHAGAMPTLCRRDTDARNFNKHWR